MAIDLERLRAAARGATPASGELRRPRAERRTRRRAEPATVTPLPDPSGSGMGWKNRLLLVIIGIFVYSQCAGDKPERGAADPREAAPAVVVPDAPPAAASPPPRVEESAPPPAELPPLLDRNPPTPGPQLAVQDIFEAGVTRLPTAAGLLRVVRSGGTDRLELDGVPFEGPSGAVIRLLHRAAFSDREVVTGVSGCRSAGSACRPDRPFFVLMRPGLPVRVLQSEGIRVGAGFGAIEADASGVAVDLGIDRGAQWRATLTTRDGIHVGSQPALVRALDDARCAEVSSALRECSLADAASCTVPGASAAQLSAARRSALSALYADTTGFNQRGFLALCSAACTERAVPSPGRVFAEACAGSDPDQWANPTLPWLPGAPPVRASVGGPSAAPPAAEAVAARRPRLDAARSPPTSDFYPDSARRAGIEGMTVIDVCADARGRVDGDPTVRETSGSEALDKGAVRWARRARFLPDESSGEPVPGCTAVRVRFKLLE